MGKRKDGQKSYTASQLMKRQIRQLALLLALLLTVVAILVWSTNRRINQDVEEMISAGLEDNLTKTAELIFGEDPYLAPDTAYLVKLKNCFYEGRVAGSDAEVMKLQEDILINIRKGVQYNSSTLRSTYLMLADEEAPFAIRNGHIVTKSGLLDTAWMDSCVQMQQDTWVEWRRMRQSYLHNVEVISVYRRIVSEHWATGETVEGYRVLNLDQTSLTTALQAYFDSSESVYLYNESLREGLFIGETDDTRRELLENLVQANMGADGRWQGQAQGRFNGANGVPVYYKAAQPEGNLLLLSTKADVQFRPMLSNVYQVLVGILLLCCLIIMGLGATNLHHLRNYDQGLRKLMRTAAAEETEPTPERSTQQDLNQVVDRLLTNAIDLPELEAVLQSEKELKTELQLLYGHTQINSHFLLNTLDSIYWSSVRNNGVDSDESAMIENLCMILKFALDSSSLYTSLKEEAEVARLYLEIMRIRRRMPLDVVWRIPPELMGAKVSKLIMQPIVENCIQHASSRETPLRIEITAREENGVLILAISDNGEGMNAAEMHRFNAEMKKNRSVHGRHIGMANVNRRIQVQYGAGYGVTLSQGETGGLCVTMRMACIPFVPEGL